jgi:hypothetical protein
MVRNNKASRAEREVVSIAELPPADSMQRVKMSRGCA